MSKSLPLEFKRRFLEAYENSEYTSHRQLSLDIGWSESRINRIITGQFDDSKDGPGFFGLVRACERLGVTPDYLAGIHKWSQPSSDSTLNAVNLLKSVNKENKPPEIETMMGLYVRSGARLEAFLKHKDYFDLYEAPNTDTQRIKCTHVGAKSLSALRMGEGNPVILQEAYDKAPAPFQQRIFDSHLRAYEGGLTVEVDAIDERMENKPVHVKIDYIRVAMSLSDVNGDQHLLIFCQLIPL